MDQQDPVIACLHRLEADNRRMKRVGAAALGLLALGLFAAAMAWQQEPDTVAVQNVVRTQRLELTNAEGKVVAVLSAVDQDEEIVTAYRDTGLKWRQVPVKNNRFEGRYVEWNQLGLKTEEGDYRNGVRHGLWRFWRTDWGSSFLRTQGAYLDGVETGIWTRWHTPDQKEFEGESMNGQKVGNWRFWNEDGSIDGEQTGFYENGVKIS